MKIKFIYLMVSIIIIACYERQPAGEHLSVDGFYSKPDEIIKKYESVALGFHEHFLLGLANKSIKQYRKSIYHFANSCFKNEQKSDLRILPASVFRFVDEYHSKSEFYPDAMYEIANLFYLYREFEYVTRFINLMKNDGSALYRDAVVLKSRALLELKKYGEAIESLKKILPDYGDAGSQSIIRIRLGSSYKRKEENENAITEFFKVLEIDGKSWQSDVAASEIINISKIINYNMSARQRLLLGMSLYHNKKYAQSLELLSGIDLKENSAMKSDVTTYLVKSYIRTGKTGNANKLIAAAGENGFNYIKTRADVQWAMHREGAAIADYRSLYEKKIAEFEKAVLKKLVIYHEERKLAGFERYIKEYIEKYPEDEKTGYFYRLLIRDHIVKSDFAAAKSMITAYMSKNPSGDWSDYMRFWLYKIDLMEGKNDDALNVAMEMASVNPSSAYTCILLDRISKQNDIKKIRDKLASAGNAAEAVFYHSLLTLIEKNPEERDKRLSTLRPYDSESYNEFERMIENLDLRSRFAGNLRGLSKYFAVGSIEAINRELSIIPDEKDVLKDKYIALSNYGNKYNHYHFAVISTIELLKLFNLKNNIFLMHPGTINRLFPKAFTECVRQNAVRFKVDMPLIYAVMRAESLYNNNAVSSAGAVGLMQLMPQTARGIANQLRLAKYDLKIPCVSIMLGAQYLSWLGRNFKGNIDLMAAAYNAGPGNVSNWKQKYNSGDIDMFTEKIPFDETRDYILRMKKHLIQGGTVYR